jgi:C4-dicarboxylate-specific signal transduction histidine kinase
MDTAVSIRKPMHLLRDMPIRRKLTFISLLTSGVALMLACVAFLTYEMVLFRTGMVDALSSTAAMVADNSSAALTFNDPVSAAQTLKSLRAHSHIVGAAIYDAHGNVFAEYRRGPSVAFRPPATEPNGRRFESDGLKLFSAISLAGERVGTVFILSDLDEMRGRLRQYAVIVILVMALASVVTYLLTRWLQEAISGPVAHLAGIMDVVAGREDYSVRATKQGEDELGALIEGFNHMLDQIQERDRALHEARQTLEARVQERTAELQKEILERERAQTELEGIHRQLLTTSRQAGMAEVATNVLHNVGNVLNSVNVSANLVVTRMQKSGASGLAKVVALLRAHDGDLGTFITTDSRGKHVVRHLENLSEHLKAEQTATVQELESLRANIDHIKDIVTMQQSYAKVAGVQEIINVIELVEDSLRLNAGALVRHGVGLLRDFEGHPVVNLDKHKVLQILVNLVRNAKYACEESGRSDRQITLRVASLEGRVAISVIDNGVGIAPQNLTRIFNHGFTTRAAGHGFGLHSGALAARELGGSLTAHSDGPGLGARFTLELPLHSAEPANA